MVRGADAVVIDAPPLRAVLLTYEEALAAGRGEAWRHTPEDALVIRGAELEQRVEELVERLRAEVPLRSCERCRRWAWRFETAVALVGGLAMAGICVAVLALVHRWWFG